MIKDNIIARRIIGTECPTDKVAERIIGVLEEYDSEGQYQVTSRVDDDFDETGLKYYRAYSEKGGRPDLVMVVREGMDNYVAKVVDAYIE